MAYYSKRPPTAATGRGHGGQSFEQQQSPSIPRPARVPAFGPHGPNSYSPKSGYSPYSTPAAPGSLSPVAMGPNRDAVATGPQYAQQQDQVVVRARPTFKLGVTILLAGAIVGGFIGIVSRQRQVAAEIAFASQANMQAQAQTIAPPVAAPPPPPTPIPFPTALPPPVVTTPPPAPSGSVAHNDAKDSKKAVKHGPGIKITQAPVAEDPPDPPKTKKSKKGADVDDDGYRVASAEGSKPKAEKAEKPEPKPEPKAEKAEKPEPKPEKSEKTADKPKKKSDDAASVLKAAMGATENTL